MALRLLALGGSCVGTGASGYTLACAIPAVPVDNLRVAKYSSSPCLAPLGQFGIAKGHRPHFVIVVRRSSFPVMDFPVLGAGPEIQPPLRPKNPLAV